ncbi:MAG TPA: flagellar hook capping FlgD N-terminal domain-containing protein [Bryobacteraceae bacterium]|nr:flagellar hook capping FlgD N-terminal domain-containing protein [Bryobacteraceae bacterium]
MNVTPATLSAIMQPATLQPASIQRAAAATDPSSSNPTQSSSPTAIANETTFLQLLVAQIKNQDPTQPTDGTQFLSQLAQFSQLEQLIGIKQDLDTSTKTPASGSTGSTPQANA